MEAEIRRIFKDEHFAYHAIIDETGIEFFATNKHGEVVKNKHINKRELKMFLDL